VSEERVAMRVLQGGHDVPLKKLKEPYHRTLKDLVKAVREMPHAPLPPSIGSGGSLPSWKDHRPTFHRKVDRF
jgi:hypothetical protein